MYFCLVNLLLKKLLHPFKKSRSVCTWPVSFLVVAYNGLCQAYAASSKRLLAWTYVGASGFVDALLLLHVWPNRATLVVTFEQEW
jgi:hypothetical protein